MEWIKLSEQEPNKYEEVIICSDTGIVKTAIYMGNYKWSTYNQVVLWMNKPKAPNWILETNENQVVEQPKKKRGRPRKI